jgi:hypothetical protein
MLLQVTLTPAEGKRLIGKAIAAMDVVQKAMKSGIIVIATSTTTGYVLEELLGKKIDKGMFTAGVVTWRGCCITDPEGRYRYYIVDHGEVSEMELREMVEVLERMRVEDIFIKGANAVDPYGSAAIFLGSPKGGTIGASIGYLTAKGVRFIIAAGLEKLVPYPLEDVAPRTGIEKVDISLGMPVGLMVVHGEVVTEIEAFKLLTGVEATPIGGGGIDGGEGSKTLLIEGDEEAIKKTYELLLGIKGEPPLKTRTMSCEVCRARCIYKELE